MGNQIVTLVSGIVLGIGLILVLLPKILRKIGLHPHYEGESYNLEGKRALLITTSHDSLGDQGKKTGVYASEMTVPYYQFLDAKMTVDLASIRGGKIPIESASLKYPLATPQDRRFLQDVIFKGKVENSMSVDDVDVSNYDLIFLAGGWGAAYDLGTSQVLGEKLTQANATNKVLGSVCHGALGFVQAKEVNGQPLVKGKKMTAVTDKQVHELKITITPMHPETELRKLGANFKSNTAFKDVFANLVLVDGNIVTGQNQNAGAETAQTMMRLLIDGIKKGDEK
ncbi:type 1 glutamine amidotransferase domain-containing protein [Gottschalkiaceae bacterium SANA]|nr:type 1 glutamine amidotransferase domain-containing protein [Gottschalkiaceae bacterium SANA]